MRPQPLLSRELSSVRAGSEEGFLTEEEERLRDFVAEGRPADRKGHRFPVGSRRTKVSMSPTMRSYVHGLNFEEGQELSP